MAVRDTRPGDARAWTSAVTLASGSAPRRPSHIEFLIAERCTDLVNSLFGRCPVRRRHDDRRATLLADGLGRAEQPCRLARLLPRHRRQRCSLQGVADDAQITLVSDQQQALAIRGERSGNFALVAPDVSQIAQRAGDAAAHGIALAVIKLPVAKRGIVLLARRWVGERSFAWASRFRRFARDCERLPETVAGLHVIAVACLMLRQLLALAAQCP